MDRRYVLALRSMLNDLSLTALLQGSVSMICADFITSLIRGEQVVSLNRETTSMMFLERFGRFARVGSNVS